MKRKFYFVLSLILIATVALAGCFGGTSNNSSQMKETYSFKGKIKDYEESPTHTKLTAQLGNNSATIDENGVFNFTKIEPGNYKLKIIHEDGATISSQKININSNELKTIKLRERIEQQQINNAKELYEKPNKKIKSFFGGGRDEELLEESTPGRILMTPDPKTSGWKHGHSAIASYGNETIEALPNEGVVAIPNNWSANYDSYAVLDVEEAGRDEHYGALEEARSHIGSDFNDDYWWYRTTDEFYCSQLVWRAWHEQGYDLNDGGIVFPDDLVESEATSAVYSKNMDI